MSDKNEIRKDKDKARRLKEMEYKQQQTPHEKSRDEFSAITRHFQRTRFALEEGNETLQSLLVRIDDVKEDLPSLRKKLSLAQKERKEALRNLEKTGTKEPKQHAKLTDFLIAEDQCQVIRIALTDSIQQEHHMIRKAVDQAEEELKSLHRRMEEKNEELGRTRNAVLEKDEELRSFKDRVAEDVASSIKTGKGINLNNPVSKPRIIELYEDLRLKWPKIKSSLKSKGENLKPSKVRDLMQNVFDDSKAEMEKKMKLIDGLFELNKAISDTAYSKVKEYRQLTIQNLQLAIYSEKKQDLKDVMDYLKRECFWLGRLMALNDPPLEPDWHSPPTTCDEWDILPHNITECQKDHDKIAFSKV